MAAPAEDRCDHELLRADCSFCRPRPPRPPAPAFAQPSEYGPWITAEYHGRCAASCDINPGERIRSDGRGNWLCTDCGEDLA